ncbi:hypothetical protein MMPV_000472 [Pyropia vietnamensis]
MATGAPAARRLAFLVPPASPGSQWRQPTTASTKTAAEVSVAAAAAFGGGWRGPLRRPGPRRWGGHAQRGRPAWVLMPPLAPLFPRQLGGGVGLWAAAVVVATAGAAGEGPTADVPRIPDDLDLDPTGAAAAAAAAAAVEEAAADLAADGGDGEEDDDAAADSGDGEGVSMGSPTKPAAAVARWIPEGLLGAIVDEKRLETELLEADLAQRPDHPLNLRLAFYAPSTPGRLGRAIRRGDGRVAIIGAFKRFAPAAYDDAQGLGEGRWSVAAGNLDDSDRGRGLGDGGRPQTGRLLASLDDIARDARRFASAGVSALAVHLDTPRYGTDVADLAAVVKAVAGTSAEPGPPVLAIDVVVHPLQVAAAAEAGASAVTLVAAGALPDLETLLNTATLLGLEGVVECATEVELAFALDAGATAVCLTNLDRSTGRLRPGQAMTLRRDVPEWVTTIAAGGIRTAGEAWAAANAGFDAVMLGEVLLKTRRLDGFVAEVHSQQRDVADRFFGAMGYNDRDDPTVRPGARRL